MNPLQEKITAEVAEGIRAKIKSMDFGAIEKIRKAKEENGTFDVIISTEVVDRAGEIVRQDGWDLANYKNNPIVLWGHDYYSLPIGVCTDTYNTTYRGVPALGARGVFFPADVNPLAQQVRRMYEYGVKSGSNVGCTTSVGFIPKDFDKDDQRIITRAELLEFSFVPVPANQGVGPASGRSLTFDEAKELSLDVAGLRVKGIEFVEAEKKEEKAAEAGDDCSMDDGSAGTLASDPKDPDGPLVCAPAGEDKDAKADAGRTSQKKLMKSIGDEHERHAGEVEKAFDDFREKSAVVEDQGDPAEPNGKAKKDGKTEVMRECLKDLRDSLRDEHDMHRANSVKCFKSFDPAEDKAFDRKEHVKALRGAHDDYETKCMKAMDEFETRCMKSVQGEPGERDEHADWITGKMEESQRVHKKAVGKIAKGMCKEAFGEEDQADEKVLAILNEHLAAFVPEGLQRAVFFKVGARISAATKEKLGAAHEHLKSAKAILEELHGGLADGDGEEKPAEGKANAEPAPVKEPRSKPRQSSRSDDEALKAHLRAREIVGGIKAAAREALGKINTDIRARGKK